MNKFNKKKKKKNNWKTWIYVFFLKKKIKLLNIRLRSLEPILTRIMELKS